MAAAHVPFTVEIAEVISKKFGKSRSATWVQECLLGAGLAWKSMGGDSKRKQLSEPAIWQL
eukprot:4356490-Amphidinium_carterae.1